MIQRVTPPASEIKYDLSSGSIRVHRDAHRSEKRETSRERPLKKKVKTIKEENKKPETFRQAHRSTRNA
ncbi:hypothetical protein PV327_007711, partial [Microctonus hyperodae]